MVVSDPSVNGALPMEPFMLEANATMRPTTFDITFLAGSAVYRCIVEGTVDGILYESLEQVGEKGSIDVFEREETRSEPAHYKFNDLFFSASDHLAYVAKGTRKNQTFLGNAVSQNVIELREAYDWFANTLELVGVGSHARSFASAADSHEGFLEYAGNTLSRLDTGIIGLGGERVDMDALPKDAELRKRIAELNENELITIIAERAAGDYELEVFAVHAGEDRPVAGRMRAPHTGPDKKGHGFGLGMGSSGAKRPMGLLPMPFDLRDEAAPAKPEAHVADGPDRCLRAMPATRLAGGPPWRPR